MPGGAIRPPRAVFFAYFVAVVETLIAVPVILGFARKPTYISAIAFSVMIWATAEGFGGPYTSGAADIGTAVIYAVFFIGLLALMGLHRPGPLQRGLLPRAEDLVVAEGRRGRPPRPGAARPGHPALTPGPAASPVPVVPLPRTPDQALPAEPAGRPA